MRARNAHFVLTLVWSVLALTALSAPASAATRTVDAAASASSSCADVIVYVVRGSGEAPKEGAGAQPYDPANPTEGYADAWDTFDPIDESTGASSILSGDALTFDKKGKPSPATGTPFLYDLVQKVHARVGGQLKLSWAPIRYPAVPVDDFASKVRGVLWLVDGYPKSATSGIRELHRNLKRQWDACGTKTRYVLAGYSQGADVVNSYLRGKIFTQSKAFGVYTESEFLGPTLEIAKQIAAVTLIADPNHDPSDPESYTNVDSRMSHQGGLTHSRAGIPKPEVSVTDSICLPNDPVCGQGTRKPDLKKAGTIHSDGYRKADVHPVACKAGEETLGDESAITCMADRITWRLGVRNLKTHPLDEASSAPGTSGRDVAFLIDTTGSMQDDIDSALEFAKSEADRIVSLDGRVALVQYRDNVDDVPAEVVVPFTSDMTEFQDGLGSLTADGGGDDPEALLHALRLSFDNLGWQYGASKATVILTDAGFHEPDLVDGSTVPQIERRSLEIDPVNVFPVVNDVSAYEGLAARTSGEVIDKSSGDTETALTQALDNIAARPTAVLSNGTYFAAAGRDIHFDASASRATSGDVAEYRWDLDGNGFTDETTTKPTIDHRYPAGYNGQMQVLVVDDAGRSANASAAVIVDEKPTTGLVPRVPAATSMTADAEDAGKGVRLDVAWKRGIAKPARWVVAVNGDPVATTPGEADSVRTSAPYQHDDWRVTVTPMDRDGNLGDSYTANLDPVPGHASWQERPVVWASGGVAGLLTAILLWWTWRRRSLRPQERGLA